MEWRVSKQFIPRPSAAVGLSSLPGTILLLLLVLPLLLAGALVVAVVLAGAALYRLIWRGLGGRAQQPDPASAAATAPVRILDTPTLVVELLEPDAHPLPPALAALHEAWWEQVDADSHGYYYQLRSTPELPGLHGQLVSSFQYAWQGGLLLQVLQPATDAQPMTSFLVRVEPAGASWEKVAEVGPFNVYRHPDFPADYLEGWNQQLGRLQLRLEAAAPTAPG